MLDPSESVACPWGPHATRPSRAARRRTGSVLGVRRLETTRHLAHEQRRAVDALVDTVQAADGHAPLSDHLLVALHSDRSVSHATLVHDDDGLIAYAQASRIGDSWIIGLVVRPDATASTTDIAVDAIAPLLDAIRDDGAGRVNWWIVDPTDAHAAAAARLGLDAGRELLQMRVALPVGAPTDIATRPFVVGVDEPAWLAVNNRAFAWHDEQGNWDLDTLAAREAEPWFEPGGFLLHERDGALAGYCWTKIHRDIDPPVGEIYVIGVDPDLTGHGLGRALTVAGLDSMVQRGVHTGMLFVDGTNDAAIGLYTSLGFTIHRHDRAYTALLDDTAPLHDTRRSDT